jgi:RNA binding exosome subunit
MDSSSKELTPKEMEDNAKKYEALKKHFSNKYYQAVTKVSEKKGYHGIIEKPEAECYERGFTEALDYLRVQLENDLR